MVHLLQVDITRLGGWADLAIMRGLIHLISYIFFPRSLLHYDLTCVVNPKFPLRMTSTHLRIGPSKSQIELSNVAFRNSDQPLKELLNVSHAGIKVI